MLGREGAARFQRHLLSDILLKASELEGRLTLYLALSGANFSLDGKAHSKFKLFRQRGNGLGERLQNAFRFLLSRHLTAVVTGTDSPELSRGVFLRAFEELRWCDAVLGRCPDGGYYLVGLRCRPGGIILKDLFGGIRWGGRWALDDTLRNMARLGLACSLLEPCADVDRPRDVLRLAERMSEQSSLRRRAPSTWRFLAAQDVKNWPATQKPQAKARRRKDSQSTH